MRGCARSSSCQGAAAGFLRGGRMAGGLGFEPRLAESESAVLPLDDPPPVCRPEIVAEHRRQLHRPAGAAGAASESTLGVLRAAAGLAPADLLALDLTGIAGNEARLTQGLAQGRVVLHQCAGDAVANRAGLAGDAAAPDLHLDIELPGELRQFE